MTDLDPTELERLAAIGASHVCDVQGGRGALDPVIRQLWTSPAFAGPARTGRSFAGHNDAVRAAVGSAVAGEVVVIDGQAHERRAILGDLIGRRARDAGVVGVVIDGAVRDLDGLEALGLPIHARGTSPATPVQAQYAENDVPVSVGGVSISPGDIVVADRDGIAVIPRADARRVFEAADAAEKAERAMLESAGH